MLLKERIDRLAFGLGLRSSFDVRRDRGPTLATRLWRPGDPLEGGASRRILEEIQIAEGFVIVDLQTGANTGDWVSLETYNRMAVVFLSAVGTAADDPTLTLQEATDNAGAGAQNLNFTRIYRKQAAVDLSGTAQWVETTQVAANTFTNATAAEEDLIWVVEFRSTDLDVDDGYTFLRATVADIGANAQLGYLMYIASEPRYPAAPAAMRGIL